MAKKGFSDFDHKLKQVNLRLEAANTRPRIERKGDSLYLRATLPPKPNSDRTSPYQQHLSLKVKANPEGLKRAEAKAKKVGAALDLKEFDWVDYLEIKPKINNQTAGDWIAAFKADYFEHHERTPTTEGTFRNGYHAFLKRLPQNQVLTGQVLELVIKASKLNSYSRAKICKAFKRFGAFAGIDVSFIDKKLRGTYSPNRPAPRELPPDELIVEAFRKIPNPKWRRVYGLIATYGLRPHEVFHLDTENLEQGGYLLKVLENTKTGYREVHPLHPEWVDQFGLRQKQLPSIKCQTNRDFGRRVGSTFRRYRLPFPSYHLRHCYATRCIRFKVEVSLAARWMGHSVAMHTNVYQAHLSKAIEREAFERAINDPNRPQPPS